jgi:hemolysin D
MSARQPLEPIALVESRRVVPARPRLRRGDHEFLPAALEILETPRSPIRSAFIPTICGFVVAALAWSYTGRLDVIAAAQGKIQAVGRTKTIQPLETGKVRRLAVENGQSVKAGDLLLELDSSESKADEGTLTSEIQALKAEEQRRSVAIEVATTRRLYPMPEIAWSVGTDIDSAQRESHVLAGDLSQLASAVASLEGQTKQKAAARDRLKAAVTAEETLLTTLSERVNMRSELYRRNIESKASVIDAQEVYQRQQATLADEKGQLGEVDAEALTAQRDIDKAYADFVADNTRRLNDAARKIEDDVKKLEKARLRTDHMTLTSPIDGVVQGLAVTTVGQVIASGEQIMQIVPDGAELEIECYLPNADAGFVTTGQLAVVKVESFPFTDYGTVGAHVTRIAHDAIPQIDANQREQDPIYSSKSAMFGGAQRVQNLVYPVTLKLDATTITVDGSPIPLTPGMAVTIEIKTGDRRILSYVFSPLIATVSTAMKER